MLRRHTQARLQREQPARRRAGRGSAALLALALCATCLWTCAGNQREQALRDAELHYKLGDGHFRDHQVAAAIRELHLAVKANPDHAEAQHLLGFLYLGRREYELALRHLQRAVAIEPEYLMAVNTLGACYLALCQWDEAALLFERLSESPLYGTPYIAQNNLGLALHRKGDDEAAVRRFQKAVLFNAKFCVGYNNLGMALLELGRIDEAERSLREALRADPECERYAEPHLHLGRILERDGRLEAALDEYRRCHELAGSGFDIGYGCGQTPVGLRCEQKVRQLGGSLDSVSGEGR